MFEVCDPVEDDKTERYSVDSLETGSASGCPREAFRLHGDGRKCQLFRLPGNVAKPGGEAMKRMWNCEIDESVLVSKGLQLNEDGSFSKSPREECLPFVMPAEKVAEIRRKKQELGKRFSRDEIDPKGASPVKMEVASVLAASRSSNCVGEDVKTGGNLTDSMKEALVRKRWEQEKTRLPKWKPAEQRIDRQECRKKSEELVRTTRNPKKNRSDLQLPSIQRPRLSYYQRYQKESGFDPQSISLKAFKPVKDTARSVFGDSARDPLSDVSSRISPVVEDETEESFYQKIIAGVHTRADITGTRTQKANASRSVERSKEINFECKAAVALHGTKPSPGGSLVSNRSTKKVHTLCGRNPERIPKAELVSKARAYGNQANTRNIVKLQMKSLRKREGSSARKAHQKTEDRRQLPFLPPLEDQKTFQHHRETNSLLERKLFRHNLTTLKDHFPELRNLLEGGGKG